MFDRIGGMADKAQAVLDNGEKATKPLSDEKLHKDIQGSIASIHVILHEIANGQGYPTRLLKDPQEAERISGIVKNLEGASKEAEGTLKGAQNLLKTNPYPSLHLSKLFKQKGDMEQARSYADKAIELDGDSLDAWAYLFALHKDADGEDAAVAAMEKLAADKKTSRPYVAMQAYFGNNAETRDKAIDYGQKALAQNPDDVPGAVLAQLGNRVQHALRAFTPREAKALKAAAETFRANPAFDTETAIREVGTGEDHGDQQRVRRDREHRALDEGDAGQREVHERPRLASVRSMIQ